MQSAAALQLNTPTRLALFGLGLAALIAAPYLVYPVFLMNALCFALFACAFMRDRKSVV